MPQDLAPTQDTPRTALDDRIPRSGGRPSSYTPEAAKLICERIAGGESLRAICESIGIPKVTVLRWLRDHEGFRTQYALSREDQADHYADENIEIADDSRNDWMERQRKNGDTYKTFDREHVERSKTRIMARQWVMERMAPKKYALQTAAVTVNINLGDALDEALRRVDALTISGQATDVTPKDENQS